jgi:hypothetical protein
MNYIQQYESGFLGDRPSEGANFETLEDLFNVPFVKFYVDAGEWTFSKYQDNLVVTHTKMLNSWFIGKIKFPDEVNLAVWVYA